ncbi:MAG: hypothetical protein ABI345_06985 [Jatrophihabitans sp.]
MPTVTKQTPPRRRTVAAYGLAALLTVTGALHFLAPHGFESIVPGFLGSPAFWVAASGAAELTCAAGLLLPRTRSGAGWACVVLFIAVFPANVTMAVHALNGDGSVLVSLVRLPLQIPLVLWAYYIARDDQPGTVQVSSARCP